LSASTPFHKGKILNTDTRWEFICQSVDDRNENERKPGGISKSRYSPISLFLSDDKKCFSVYNDTKITLNRWARRFLKIEGKKLQVDLDKKLLNHFSYLFVRDNLCVFKGTLEKEISLEETKLFEAIQSSNWNDVRLKPPPSMESPIGWRVEFRSMDVQLTAELTFLFNHAVLILSRILIHMRDRLNFYIPISKIDENFRRANLINAAVEQKFFFRTNVFDAGLPLIEELSIYEIFAGKEVLSAHPGKLHRDEQNSRSVFKRADR
jgi:glutamate--cysteine ligase catalytic subunit